MNSKFDLTGKVAIITGGNGGLGLGIAKGLASVGAKVAVVGRNQDKIDNAVEQLQADTRRNAKADPSRDVAFLIRLDALIFRTEAELRWLDACEARIRSLEPPRTKETRR